MNGMNNYKKNYKKGKRIMEGFLKSALENPLVEDKFIKRYSGRVISSKKASVNEKSEIKHVILNSLLSEERIELLTYVGDGWEKETKHLRDVLKELVNVLKEKRHEYYLMGSYWFPKNKRNFLDVLEEDLEKVLEKGITLIERDSQSGWHMLEINSFDELKNYFMDKSINKEKNGKVASFISL